MKSLGLLLGLLTALYAWLAVWVSRRTVPGAAHPNATTPAVSVLKPLCGAEPDLYQHLRSFCVQQAARYQIVFGLHDPSDPALAVVRALQAEFAALPISVVIDGTQHGSNAKVSNLLNMLPHAQHELLLLSDSDIAVPGDYLARVLAPLADPAVGLVTCAYVGRARPGAASALGALFINDWFMPQVRLAARLGSQAFVSGASIALSRSVLARSGGFEALANQLADDFKLGEQVRRLGLKVVLAELMLDTQVHEPSFGAWWRHCLRWLRTVYSIQPLGYALCFITLSLPMALLSAFLTHFSSTSLVLLGVTVLARLMLHFRLQERGARAGALQGWLVLPHDMLLFALWCWSFCNRRVTWREGQFDVAADGSLQRL